MTCNSKGDLERIIEDFRNRRNDEIDLTENVIVKSSKHMLVQ